MPGIDKIHQSVTRTIFQMPGLPYQRLFSNTDFTVLVDTFKKEVQAEITRMPAETFLNTSVEEMIRYLVEKHTLSAAPTIDRRGARTTQREGEAYTHTVPSERFRDSFSTGLGTIYTLTVPYSGERSHFYLRPSRFSPQGAPIASSTETDLLIEVAGVGLEASRIDAQFDEALDLIEKYLAWLQFDVEAFNKSIPEVVKPLIETRRAKLLQDQKTGASLKYPLMKRIDAPDTYMVPAIKKKISVSFPTQSTRLQAEPTLDDEHYKNILNIVEKMTGVIERSPKAFEYMDEEDIRFHYLLQLNAQYDGTVGEAFNYNGKTDILVRYEGKNLFIAECKFGLLPVRLTPA